MESFRVSEITQCDARDTQKPHSALSLPEAAVQRAPIPDVASAMPSHGSALHSTGQCQPCAWFWRPEGCHNGEACRRCHLCPEGEIKARKKNKVAMMRLGLVTPKHASSKAVPLEPLKVDLGMIKSFSEEVGFAMGGSPSIEEGKAHRSSSIPPKKLDFPPTTVCASEDEVAPSQSPSEEKECSTASGSEVEGTTSASSAAGCASDDEGPMAASRTGDMVASLQGCRHQMGRPAMARFF